MINFHNLQMYHSFSLKYHIKIQKVKLLGVNMYEFQFWFYLPLLRNLETPELPVYSVHGHKEIINTIDGVGGLGIGEGAPEIVTGSRDGKNLLLIKLFKMFQLKL